MLKTTTATAKARPNPFPTRKDFRFVHEGSTAITNAIQPHTKPGRAYRLVMMQHLWTQWTNKSSGVFYARNQSPFPIDVRGQKHDCQDHVNGSSDSDNFAYLIEPSGKIVGRLDRITDGYDQQYHIHGLRPFFEGQRPCRHDNQGSIALYLWAEITVFTIFSIRFEMAMADGKKYVADSFGSFFGCRNMRLRQDGRVCAVMSESRCFNPSEDVYLWNLIIGPGIDPCLVVALMAIIDRFSTDRERDRSYEKSLQH